MEIERMFVDARTGGGIASELNLLSGAFCGREAANGEVRAKRR